MDKRELNNNFEFNVYRTFTDSTISADPCHPITHKLAAFNSIIHRAVSLSLSQLHRLAEFQTIRQIAVQHGFSNTLINKLIYKKFRKAVINQIYPITSGFQEIYYATIPYSVTMPPQISNIFSKLKI